MFHCYMAGTIVTHMAKNGMTTYDADVARSLFQVKQIGDTIRYRGDLETAEA